MTLGRSAAPAGPAGVSATSEVTRTGASRCNGVLINRLPRSLRLRLAPGGLRLDQALRRVLRRHLQVGPQPVQLPLELLLHVGVILVAVDPAQLVRVLLLVEQLPVIL